MSGQKKLDSQQGELFKLSAIKVAKSCKECVYFHQDPYNRCLKQNNALLKALEPCPYFLFARDFNALLGCKDKDMEVIINNKIKEIL